MNPQEQDKLAEQLIDEALKRHSLVEPRFGLEQRILSKLAERQLAVRRTRWLAVLVPAALALAVVVAMLFGHKMQTPYPLVAVKEIPPAPSQQAALPERQPLKAGRTISASRLRSVRPSGVPKTESIPRMARFPSPQPLSTQEQLLVRYVTQHPKEAVQFAKLQQEPLTDLKIEEIQVAPLTEDSKTNSDENR